MSQQQHDLLARKHLVTPFHYFYDNIVVLHNIICPTTPFMYLLWSMTRESLFTLFCFSHMMAMWLELITSYVPFPFHSWSKTLFP